MLLPYGLSNSFHNLHNKSYHNVRYISSVVHSASTSDVAWIGNSTTTSSITTPQMCCMCRSSFLVAPVGSDTRSQQST